MVYKVKTDAGGLRVSGSQTYIGMGVKTSNIGMLVCDEHESAWCEHVEYIIRTNMDSFSIFNEYENYNIARIYVPVLPVDWNIFACVVLEYVDRDTLKAYLWNATKPRVLTDDYIKNGAVFIGLVGRGDGRKALRSMILEWVAVLPECWPTKCRSASHTRSREREIRDEILQDKRSRIAHTWCIHWYNKCARCTLEEGPEHKFDDDLIPTI